MIQAKCRMCGEELTDSGADLYSTGDQCARIRLCQFCFSQIIG